MENNKKVIIKNGKEYEVDPKKYYQNFKDKHVEKIECEICGGKYNYFSKYLHFKSKKHTKCEQIIENYKNKNV